MKQIPCLHIFDYICDSANITFASDSLCVAMTVNTTFAITFATVSESDAKV